MLICLDQRTGTGCGAQNRDGARFCCQCGRPLRFALQLHNVGAQVGNYRIAAILGYGSFGVVYQAQDMRRPGLLVALKETFEPDSIRSFKSEFAILSRLHHANLPAYYEMFEANGNGYLVMEYVPGQTLDDVLRKQGGPLLESQVLGYAMQVCDALSYLHGQKLPILHRDVKPANIRLTPEGLIKLVDFGLLKQGTGQTQSSRRGLTTAYAPIEQWTGGTDPRSDLFSLGATLYHLLTGQTAPVATDRLAVANDPLMPPQQLNPKLSPHVAAALLVALALRPVDRYRDVVTFKLALSGSSQAAPSVSPAAVSSMAKPPVASSAAPTIVAGSAIVVAADGSGQYRTISEALKNAAPNARVLVRPAIYRESLVLDKPVEIVGDGSGGSIIVESSKSPCILMKTGQATVRKLVLWGRCGLQGKQEYTVSIPQGRSVPPHKNAGARGKQEYTVSIPQGQLLLEDCVIASDSLACVGIHGKFADPTLRRCKIHNGKQAGILVTNGARGVIEGCDVLQCAHGIEITQGGSPTIRGCKIHEQVCGIWVHDAGQGTVEDSEIFKHSSDGILVEQSSAVSLRRCKIYQQGATHGVSVNSDGQGVLEECSIYENRIGVRIAQGATLDIRKCKINKNQYYHIVVEQNGAASVEGCDLTGNGHTWSIASGSMVHRANNKE